MERGSPEEKHVISEKDTPQKDDCLLPKRTGLQSGDYMPWPAKSRPVHSSEPDGDATDVLCHLR